MPVLFNPVVVENYHGRKKDKPGLLKALERRAAGNPELAQVVAGLQSYFKRDGRQYAHFVDGGIIDNLDLRAIYEIVEFGRGAKAFLKRHERKPPRRLVIISVNASTDPEPKMDVSNKQPSLEETMNAVTDIQLHRYNAATLELMYNTVARWSRELSTPGRPVTPFFIRLSFRDIDQPEKRKFFNRIPTSFSLSDEQVDKPVAAGRELLRANPEYQRFVAASR